MKGQQQKSTSNRDALEIPQFDWHFLAPKHWGAWLGVSVLWLGALLPLPVLQGIGRVFGRALYLIGGKRKRIAARNLERCFPEMDDAARHALLIKHYESVGMGFLESGAAWFWPSWKVKKFYQVEGEEYARQAIEQGGVLLLSMHFVTLEVGARMFGEFLKPGIGMYRAMKSPVFDWVQFHGRIRSNKYLISRKGGAKAMVRALRRGEVVWYAQDQDYGRDRSVFVPFFGIQTATLPATAMFARYGKVLPFLQTRLPHGQGYKLIFRPMLDNYPTGDELADAKAINDLIEAEVRLQPEQYLWFHRRFKTRPNEDDPAFY